MASNQFLSLFQTSLDEGILPSQWKEAKIIPVRKPRKPRGDYTLPSAYRSISLLCTLGKALESVLATRISYMVEENGLLPSNHFGARKRRSAVQALVILQEQIWKVWRAKKIVSLVSFDIRGAYNGISKEQFLERLTSRRIPLKLIKWIDNFCSERTANITVNGYSSELAPLPQAGLPQGSPLSPIFFLFFNATLIQQVINAKGGSLAFVDDYTAWVVGDSAEDNTRQLQEMIVNKAERWGRCSGATFEPKKTAFVHFTRNHLRISDRPLLIQDEWIKAKDKVKILGVTLDNGLRLKQHIVNATNRGMRAVLALKRLKNLPPSVTRQLFISTVCPSLDYASIIWAGQITTKLQPLLRKIQQIGASAIIGGFKTVALSILESEAGIDG